FWMDVTLIFTSGFSLVNAAAASSQYALPSPVVELCHIVRVVSPPSAGVSVLLEQPASPSSPSVATATPVTSQAFRIFRLCLLFECCSGFGDICCRLPPMCFRPTLAGRDLRVNRYR